MIPYERLDWVESSQVLLGYAVHDETRSRRVLIHNPKVGGSIPPPATNSLSKSATSYEHPNCGIDRETGLKWINWLGPVVTLFEKSQPLLHVYGPQSANSALRGLPERRGSRERVVPFIRRSPDKKAKTGGDDDQHLRVAIVCQHNDTCAH